MNMQMRSQKSRPGMSTVRVRLLKSNRHLQLTSAVDNANIKNIKQSRGCADQD